MNEQMQAMCFLAGANSIFYGCKLLTTGNPEANKDMMLFKRLGINTETIASDTDESEQQHALQTAVVDQQHSDLFYNAVQ
jgi:biotin synthase